MRTAAASWRSNLSIKAREAEQGAETARPLTERTGRAADERELHEGLVVKRPEDRLSRQCAHVRTRRSQDDRRPNTRRQGATQTHVRHIKAGELSRVIDLDPTQEI